MALTSMVITYKGNQTWLITTNEGDELSEAFYSGGTKNDYISFKSKTGGNVYNKVPYWIITYVDEVDPDNDYTPTSAIALQTYLKQQGFFDDSSGGGGGVTTFLELDDVTDSSYTGKAGWMAVVNPDELTMSLKQVTGLDQNNVVTTAYFNFLTTDTNNDILDKINAIPFNIVGETDIRLFVGVEVQASGSFTYPTGRVLKYLLKNVGKGYYGTALGATPLTWNNLELIYEGGLTIQDIEEDPNTDIINFDPLTGVDTPTDWLNAQSTAIDIQPQNEGYTLFKGTIDGEEKSFLWIGEAGLYGGGELQSTDADFELYSDEPPAPFIPTWEQTLEQNNASEIAPVVVDPDTGEKTEYLGTGLSNTKEDVITTVEFDQNTIATKWVHPAKNGGTWYYASTTDLEAQNLQKVLENGSEATDIETPVVIQTANNDNAKGRVEMGADGVAISGQAGKVSLNGDTGGVEINGGGGGLDMFTGGAMNVHPQTLGAPEIFFHGPVNYAFDYTEHLQALSFVHKGYVDGLVTGIFKPAGNWDASVGTFPTTGTGESGEVLAGNVYKVSVGGTLGGILYDVGDTFYAVVDDPGQTSSNWSRFDYNTEQATEGARGTAEIATQAETNAGTDDQKFVTPLKLKNAQLNYIPITGTEAGNPVTGDIEVNESIAIKHVGGEYSSYFRLEDGGFGFQGINTLGYITFFTLGQDGTLVHTSNNPNSKGYTSNEDHTSNITEFDYTQKKYVDNFVKPPVLDVVDSEIATGTTSEVLVAAHKIDANEISTGILTIMLEIIKSGTAGTIMFRMYRNTANTMNGSQVQLGTAAVGTTQLYYPFQRRLRIKADGNAYMYPANVGAPQDAAVTLAQTSVAWNTAVDQYILLTMQPANTGDSGYVSGFDATYKKQQ